MKTCRIMSGALAACVALAGAAGAKEPPSPPQTPAARQAGEQYRRLVEAYMSGQWAKLAEARRSLARRAGLLTARQRDDVAYVRKALADHRQSWWGNCKASKRGTIRVRCWDRRFSLTYVPGEKTGWSFRQRGSSLVCSATWNPADMDSDAGAKGSLGGRGFSKGVVCELHIWRALIGAHVLSRMTMREMRDVFGTRGPDGEVEQGDPVRKLRFQHYQSFASELAALYHVGPVARQASLVWCLAPYKLENTPPLRPRRAISAMIVAAFLQDFSKWPSLKLPDKIEDGTEKSTAMFYHFGLRKPWTLAEDRAMRDATWDFHHANRARQILKEGKLVLPNKLVFLLDVDQDKPHEARRNAWIARQLRNARAARRPAG